MNDRAAPLVVGDRVQHVEREYANTTRFGRIVRAWHATIEVEWDDGERQILSRRMVFAAPTDEEIAELAEREKRRLMAWKRVQDYRPEQGARCRNESS